jgi:hypothetical protein
MVWGIERGWAVDPAPASRAYPLALGTYHVTESITPVYARLFGIPPADATATVVLTAVKGNLCCAPGQGAGSRLRFLRSPPFR